MKMRYSIELKDRIYVEEYGFLSFAKAMGTHANKVSKNLYSKYSHKLLDTVSMIKNFLILLKNLQQMQ